MATTSASRHTVAKGLLRAGNVSADDGGTGEWRWRATDPALPFFLERYAAAYGAELDAFITAVTKGQPVQPDGGDGLQALLLADAATHSAHTGDVVRL